MSTTRGALHGLRVIELAHERIGFAGKLLADMGAEVIVVEPPGGALARQYEPFLDDLAVDVNVRAPLEVDVDHGDARTGLAAYRFDAGRAVERGFQRKGDQRFHVLGSIAGALGQNDDARPVQVRKNVDGHGGDGIAAIDQRRQAEKDNQQPVAEGKLDDCVEH